MELDRAAINHIQAMIEAGGVDAATADLTQLRNLLSDLSPGTASLNHVFLFTVSTGILSEFRELTEKISYPLARDRASKDLHIIYGYDRAIAISAIESWGRVLGIGVDSENPEPLGRGGPVRVGSRHFKSLAEALIEIAPGSTIWVVPGTYNESLVISEDHVLCVDGPVGSVKFVGHERPAVVVGAGNPEFRGITFECHLSDGARVTSAVIDGGNPRFLDCTFSSVSNDGVDTGIDQSSLIDTRRVVASDGRSGIVVTGSAAPHFERCIVHGIQGRGVVVAGSSAPRFDRCEFRQSARTGMVVLQRGSVTIRQCRVESGQSDGIRIEGDAQARIENCTIAQNVGSGLVLRDQTVARVVASEIVESGGRGIEAGGPIARIVSRLCGDS